jgi:L-seryl-tRNA(Ser) seleniumtransferase
MTLAALEATLQIYRDERQAVRQIPTLAMLTAPLPVIESRAAELKSLLKAVCGGVVNVELSACTSKAGGGSLPLLNLPSRCVSIRVNGLSANAVERWLRNHTPPIIGRIEDERFIMDARTLQQDELDIIQQALTEMLSTIDEEQ